MILIDANLLIYAYELHAPQHAKARAWLDSRINGDAPVGMPWLALLGFLRVTTNPRIIQRPEAMSQACKQVHAWLACENVWVPHPTARHAEVLSRLLLDSKATGNLTSDAHLAALAIEHGLTLCSSGGDFARFPGLRWINPLSG